MVEVEVYCGVPFGDGDDLSWFAEAHRWEVYLKKYITNQFTIRCPNEPYMASIQFPSDIDAMKFILMKPVYAPII